MCKFCKKKNRNSYFYMWRVPVANTKGALCKIYKFKLKTFHCQIERKNIFIYFEVRVLGLYLVRVLTSHQMVWPEMFTWTVLLEWQVKRIYDPYSWKTFPLWNSDAGLISPLGWNPKKRLRGRWLCSLRGIQQNSSFQSSSTTICAAAYTPQACMSAGWLRF